MIQSFKNFCQIGSQSFKVSWDVEELCKCFDGDLVDPLATPERGHLAFSDPSGKPHWQPYPTNIYFARNFSKKFPDECNEVVGKIKMLQRRLEKGKHELIDRFLEHRVDYRRVNLIKNYASNEVSPHIDKLRVLTLNIGLKNSNSGITHVCNGTNPDDFIKGPLESFQMQDGDAYLLNVSNFHSVKPVSPTATSFRYLITYTVINRD